MLRSNAVSIHSAGKFVWRLSTIPIRKRNLYQSRLLFVDIDQNRLFIKNCRRTLSTKTVRNTVSTITTNDTSRERERSHSQQLSAVVNSSNKSEVLKRLYDIARPERKLIYASAATLGITSSITLLLPYACGNVLDMALLEATNSSTSGGYNSPFTIALGLFGLTGTAGLGVYARSLMLNIAGNKIVSRVRRQLFASIVSQESAFFDKTKPGDLISRLSNDAQYIKSAVTTEAVSGLRGIVMSVGSTSLLFYTSPTLAVISLLSIPPVFIAARVVGKSLKEKQKIVQEQHGKATNVAEEIFGGFQTVQLFTAEKQEYERYADAINDAHDKEIRVGKTKAIFDGIVHVAANGAVLLVLGYGGTLVLANEMSAGDLTGFLMYSLLMAGNLSSLSGTYTEMMKSVAASGRIFDIIDRIPQIPSSFNPVDAQEEKHNEQASKFEEALRGSISISFQDIGFSYPARKDAPVLGPKFLLDVHAGENIALVGGSGSGKSTVAILLARLYNVDDGKIFLNNLDIMKLDPLALRRKIGVVSQEPLLFAGTIADNIRYGRIDASDEEVKAAAGAAYVLNFTDNLPLGLDTQVGRHGTQLSGGQKQRVAIARVILKDPPIVVLDEATSALDAQSEHRINQAFKALSEGRTVISIAHRLSTIKEADRIVVLKDGKVVETGPFQQLINAQGVFHKLVEQQMTDS